MIFAATLVRRCTAGLALASLAGVAAAKLPPLSPEAQAKMNATLGQLPVNNQAAKPSDKFLDAGFTMLSNAYALAQFYDRDADAEMAKAGMEGFQEFMVKPDQIDRILERLEKVRAKVYK